MRNLIIPAAGLSSRFPNTRPKWSLTMPSGKLLIEEVVDSQRKNNCFDRILAVFTKSQIEKYSGLENVLDYLSKSTKLEILVLEKQTNSQPDTVASAIQKAEISGQLVVKDADNMFHAGYPEGNFVGFVDLNKINEVNPANKSYIETNEIGCVVNIIEKSVISANFCCGVYGFGDANEYINSVRSILDNSWATGGELYTSNVIYEMLINGKVFRSVECDGYVDIGTLEDYQKFQSRSAVYFCDIDGVLVKNSSKFASPPWQTAFLEKNIHALVKRCKGSDGGVVLTTSRPLEATTEIKKRLEIAGVSVLGVVSDLPHCGRVLINDFANTNPYPSAKSICLPRDSEALDDYL